jgi:hypothetical protein
VPGAARGPRVDQRSLDAPPSRHEIWSPDAVEQVDVAQALLHSPIHLPTPTGFAEEESPSQYESPCTGIGWFGASTRSLASQPLDTTQASLLKYFVDHISQWVCLTASKGFL